MLPPVPRSIVAEKVVAQESSSAICLKLLHTINGLGHELFNSVHDAEF